jgi:hypothetical protein
VNHDRGWKEREVFVKVRYMSAEGLERKTKPEEYVDNGGAPDQGRQSRGALVVRQIQ